MDRSNSAISIPTAPGGGFGSFDHMGPASPAASPDGPAKPGAESIHSSRLVHDLSPRRVYAVSSKQTRTSVPALFKQSAGLAMLRPQAGGWAGALPTPEEANRKPKLLQRLEAMLDSKLTAADSLAGPYATLRAGWGAQNLRLDAYRQTLEAFLQSFTTYRPLLLKIKHEYDRALEDALRSTYEHIHMRAELAISEQQRVRAVEEARTQAMQLATQQRNELDARIKEFEERAEAAEAEADKLEDEVRMRRGEVGALRKEARQVQEENRRLKKELFARSAWGGGASAVAAAPGGAKDA